jgi:hypothetical protein
MFFFRGVQKNLASVKKDLTGYPFLQELAEREEMVRNGKLTVLPASPFFSHSFSLRCSPLISLIR